MNAAHQAACDAGLGGRHEQERQQRADVDRRELQPLERPGLAPVPQRTGEHEDEEPAVQQRAEAAPDVRERLVAPDQQQVLGALAAELRRAGEQERGNEGQREDQVAGDHEPAVEPGRQPARGEGHAEMQEDAAPEPADDQSQRVDERRVRGRQRREEPREAEQDHQHADPALRPLPRWRTGRCRRSSTRPPGRRSPRRSWRPGARSRAPARRPRHRPPARREQPRGRVPGSCARHG